MILCNLSSPVPQIPKLPWHKESNPDCKLLPCRGEQIFGSVDCNLQQNQVPDGHTHLYDHGGVPEAEELPPAEQAAEPALQQRDPAQHLLMEQVLQKLPLPLLHENLAKKRVIPYFFALTLAKASFEPCASGKQKLH